jgi:hypothetical protein
LLMTMATIAVLTVSVWRGIRTGMRPKRRR